MHVKHLLRSAFFMQVVHVLGDDDDVTVPVLLQAGQGVMSGIGDSVSGIGAAFVVEPLHQPRISGKAFRGGHILDAVLGPQPVRIAERAQPAFRRNACTGQNDDLAHEVPFALSV